MGNSDYRQLNVITDVTIKEHFHESLGTALTSLKVNAEVETVHYLVNLLERFSKADTLFAMTPEGPQTPVLAFLYGQALEAKDLQTRFSILQRLGDVAMMISGIFPGSLGRKLVDVDYYIGMGESAYSSLSDMAERARNMRPLKRIYEELSENFKAFVDVLGEVAETSRLNTSMDTLRLYEIWAKTGSPRTGDKLRQLGIEPVRSAYAYRYN